jgi:peptidoglycan/xylan/chitin deacetylase (PgdA/CDA1 family)
MIDMTLVTLILLALSHYSCGQTTLKPIFYEFANFYHFKSGAVSITFDDGSSSQFSVGLKFLDQYHYKGTFFVTTSDEDDVHWVMMNTMVKNGHEIGSHTVNHPKLKEISLDSIKHELEQSKAIIEQNIKDYQCTSLAYPFGRSNEAVRKIASELYQASRSGDYGLNFADGSYYFNLKTFVCGTHTKMKTANQYVNTAILENKWLIETYHGFDGEAYSPVTSDFFQRHLQYIKSKEDYLWIATFKDVVKYLKERQSAKIELIDSSYNFYSFNIKDCLPDSIYNFPLTLKIKIPKQWDNVKVTQNNIDAGCQIQFDVFENKYVVFDVVPDKGIVSINAGKVNTDSVSCTCCKFVVFPNPFRQSLTLLSNPKGEGFIQIYNAKGSCVMTGHFEGEIQKIDTSNWEPGVYILVMKLQGVKNPIIQKILKQ